MHRSILVRLGSLLAACGMTTLLFYVHATDLSNLGAVSVVETVAIAATPTIAATNDSPRP